MSIETAQSHWLQTDLGAHLLQREQALYDAAVADIFGFYGVQLGWLDLNALQQSRIPHLVRLGNVAGDVRCESAYLPLAESSVDLLCLPHVLEFSQNPHQTLREAERVLVPEGHLIITGFNPISVWGLRRALSDKLEYPWKGQFISVSRIKDWLALLGLEYQYGKMTAFNLPLENATWLNRLAGLERWGEKSWPVMGGVYFVVAKKRVANVTLIKPNWKQNPLKSKLAVTHKRTKPTQKIRNECN